MGELYFYENIHQLTEIQNYFVKYYGYNMHIDKNQIELKLEKINSIPVSFLYINKTFSLKLFEELLQKMKVMHQLEIDNKFNLDEYRLNYTEKIKKRFENKELYNFENDIRAMGWTDDYIDETIKLWSEFNGGHSRWGHRMISDWGKDWLKSNLQEYVSSNVKYDFESKGYNVY
jgi:hypothetical protein